MQDAKLAEEFTRLVKTFREAKVALEDARDAEARSFAACREARDERLRIEADALATGVMDMAAWKAAVERLAAVRRFSSGLSSTPAFERYAKARSAVYAFVDSVCGWTA